MATQITQLVSLQELDQRLQRKEQQLEELHQQVAVIVAEKEVREGEAEERQQRIDTLGKPTPRGRWAAQTRRREN